MIGKIDPTLKWANRFKRIPVSDNIKYEQVRISTMASKKSNLAKKLPTTGARQPLQTVIKALNVLRLFNLKQEWLGVREIGRLLELNNATVHNLLRTLADNGLVEQNAETKKYRLGLGLVALAGTKLGQLDLVTVASPTMKSLMERIGETVTLSVLYGSDLLYLAKFESTRPVRVGARIGGNSPLHCSAHGKLLLAFSSDEFINNVLSQPLAKYSENTIVDPKLIREELRQIRTQGYSVDFGGYLAEVNAIAAPVRDRTGNVISSLGTVIPASRFLKKEVKQNAVYAMEAAEKISLGLGWNGLMS